MFDFKLALRETIGRPPVSRQAQVAITMTKVDDQSPRPQRQCTAVMIFTRAGTDCRQESIGNASEIVNVDRAAYEVFIYCTSAMQVSERPREHLLPCHAQ